MSENFIFKADNVLDTLSKQIPPGFYSNMDDFSAVIAKDATFKPFGELLHSYTITKGKIPLLPLMIYTCKCSGSSTCLTDR